MLIFYKYDYLELIFPLNVFTWTENLDEHTRILSNI